MALEDKILQLIPKVVSLLPGIVGVGEEVRVFDLYKYLGTALKKECCMTDVIPVLANLISQGAFTYVDARHVTYNGITEGHKKGLN